MDVAQGRIALSTRSLEQTPGQMLSEPHVLYAQAHETAKAYHVTAVPNGCTWLSGVPAARLTFPITLTLTLTPTRPAPSRQPFPSRICY